MLCSYLQGHICSYSGSRKPLLTESCAGDSAKQRGVTRTKVGAVNTKAREEGEGGVVPGSGAGISLQPVERTTLEQISTLQPMESPRPMENTRADVPER